MFIKDYDEFLEKQSHTSLTKLLSINLLRYQNALIENDWSAADLHYKYVEKCKKAVENMCKYEVDPEEILKNQLDIEKHKRTINLRR